jgi:hypothetical protein
VVVSQFELKRRYSSEIICPEMVARKITSELYKVLLAAAR